ncbi:MAG: Bax inhibitor-1/YccA family protein [Ruthenibacterium sp.]
MEYHANNGTDNGLRWMDANVPTLGQYTVKTFGWMALGLLVTFGISIAFYTTGMVSILYRIPALPFILAIVELVVVFVLSARIQKMSAHTATVLFFAYALLNGLTFSSLLYVYDAQSAIFVFGITALYFTALAAYGFFTKRDLTSLRPILFFGAVFLGIFWILSLFLHLSQFETIVCLVGLVIFMGYTAYDTQKIKAYYAIAANDGEMAAKGSILCALTLYLDFINMFLYILRLVGRRDDS